MSRVILLVDNEFWGGGKYGIVGQDLIVYFICRLMSRVIDYGGRVETLVLDVIVLVQYSLSDTLAC